MPRKLVTYKSQNYAGTLIIQAQAYISVVHEVAIRNNGRKYSLTR